MARIHLFMCAFLIPPVLSTSTMTSLSSQPMTSPIAIATSSTPTSALSSQSMTSQIAIATSSTPTSDLSSQPMTSPIAIATSSTPTSVYSNSTASATAVLSDNTKVIVASSVNVTLSTSVAPGESTEKKFQARMTVNETYESDYSNPSSAAFQTFAAQFQQNVGDFLNKTLFGFKSVEVTNLASGSVIVDFDVVVLKSSNATVGIIVQALKAGNGAQLGYTILGNVSVNATVQPSTSSSPSPTATVKDTSSPSTTPVAPTSSTKATEIWDKAIDLATPLGTFIIVVVAVALLLILLIALICVCCKYAKLKKKTRFPEHMAINDSEWIRSSDDLLMWERNLRASEVKTTNGVSSRPVSERRT